MQFDLFQTQKEIVLNEVLLEELFKAYFDCRRNKRNTYNALIFEQYLEQNIFKLCEDIQSNCYSIGKSIAFIVNKPVKREIFAADFRDRIVHHWLINKLNPYFERIFIQDSYACRVGRGTHFGIKRVNGFIRSCSQNYTTDCYVLKLDIEGFFMHINKTILYNRLENFIHQSYFQHDKPLVLAIAKQIIFNQPTQNCIIKGSKKDWLGLPPNKSLFHSPQGCGLPIGNLTSQVFANFYMNQFDHFIKQDLKITYYGRYVDDFVIVHQDASFLKSIQSPIRNFLHSVLHLTLHPRKIYFQHYSKGLPFLGTIIKPNRIYIGDRTKGNFYAMLQQYNSIVRIGKPDKETKTRFLCSINSYLGIMKHYQTYHLRKGMVKKHLSGWWWRYVSSKNGLSKMVLR